MKLKPNYVIIPLIALSVAVLGSLFTGNGMDWYGSVVVKPSLTPPDWVFPIAWTIIYICTALSAIIIWNKTEKHKRFLLIFRTKEMKPEYKWVLGLFIINAILNASWTLFFFNMHLLKTSLVEILILEATNIALLILTWKISKKASLLLVPYVIWVGFASYLTYEIVALN